MRLYNSTNSSMSTTPDLSASASPNAFAKSFFRGRSSTPNAVLGMSSMHTDTAFSNRALFRPFTCKCANCRTRYSSSSGSRLEGVGTVGTGSFGKAASLVASNAALVASSSASAATSSALAVATCAACSASRVASCWACNACSVAAAKACCCSSRRLATVSSSFSTLARINAWACSSAASLAAASSCASCSELLCAPPPLTPCLLDSFPFPAAAFFAFSSSFNRAKNAVFFSATAFRTLSRGTGGSHTVASSE
mmetsp:Transcript_46493/g.86725  ORF Transcript_46493/g.86725 Transcript_46493/m.86725 type:complete len:253 (+) Transcript_46493:224-982(+)